MIGKRSIEQIIDVKAKVSYQAHFLAQESDACYLCSYRATRSNKYKNKNFEAKKTHNLPSTIQNNNRNGSQSE